MREKFGQQVDEISGNKVLLFIQAIFFFALAGVAFFFTTIRPIVTFDSSSLNPMFFTLIRIGVLVVFCGWGVFHVLKAILNRITFYEEGIVIRGAFSTKEFSYESIGNFSWVVTTTRLGGIFPIARTYTCTINGRDAKPLAAVTSADYLKMKPKMESLEAQLGI